MRNFLHKLTNKSRELYIFYKSYKYNKSTKYLCDSNTRKSFTMIEIVFVIVITGLVATAGSKAIVQILQNYTLQKMYAKVELDSASLIRQISNYLQNSVWDSIAFNKTTPISQVSNHTDGTLDNDNLLWFIEKDLYSLNGSASNGSMIPYFAGFVDLNNSQLDGTTNITTIKSQIATDDLVKAIGNGSRVNGLSIYFPFVNVGTSTSVNEKYYQNDIRRNRAIFWIDNADNTKRQFTTRSNAIQPRQIGDIAMLVNAYPSSIRLYKTAQGNYEQGDLVLSRREPDDNTYINTIIAKKVSNLHFWTESSSSLIRMRVCFEAGVVKSIMEEFCKEGIVMQ